MTEHAKLRWTMRIDSCEDIRRNHIQDSVRVNLSGGYNQGLWNQDVGAVFLVADNSISTVIPETDLGLETGMEQCRSCEARIMDDFELAERRR